MTPTDLPPDPDPSIEDRADRAVLLALLEGALDRGDHARAEELRRRLAELGVTVHLGVVRPRRRKVKGSSPQAGTPPPGSAA